MKIAAEAYVLDAWAVLEYLDGNEPSSTRVDEVLARARPVMSWINLGEVYYIVRRRHGADEADATARDLRPKLQLELPNETLVLEASRLKADRALGFADAFAAATAIVHDAVLLTGDPDLTATGVPWRFEDIRR